MLLRELSALSKYKNGSDFDNVSARFWKYVEKTESGCWLWNGALRYGYGRFSIGGRSGRVLMSHRFSYEEANGLIPEGLQLDHLCRVRNCVNPEHLEPVMRKENIRRGESPSAKQSRQTHCIRGHELYGENLYLSPSGKRNCRICRSASMKKHYESHKNG